MYDSTTFLKFIMYYPVTVSTPPSTHHTAQSSSIIVSISIVIEDAKSRHHRKDSSSIAPTHAPNPFPLFMIKLVLLHPPDLWRWPETTSSSSFSSCIYNHTSLSPSFPFLFPAPLPHVHTLLTQPPPSASPLRLVGDATTGLPGRNVACRCW